MSDEQIRSNEETEDAEVEGHMFTAAPKVDAPKVDAPKVDAPKVDAPKVD